MLHEYINYIINNTLHGKGDSDQLTSALFGIALTTKGSNFLELGVRSGVTTLPLLVASKILNAKLVSVDLELPNFNCPEILKSNWEFIKSDAIQYLKSNNTSFDLIFIDDWHDGNHVRLEIDLLEPYCSKSTIILLHDLMYGYTQPNYNKSNSGTECGWGIPGEFDNGGPYRAVELLDKNVWEYSTFPYCNGLTLLRKK